jgi:hypothetical protein
VINYGPKKLFTCRTDNQVGVFAKHGAWGDFIDGCTVQLSCPATSAYCIAWEQTSILTLKGVGHRVTQNARLRKLNFQNQVLWHRDKSCAGRNLCSNTDSVRVAPGQYASVQCNGVREHSAVANWASNTCAIRMDYA